MQTLDWIIVSAYFLLLIGIVRWSSRKTSSAADYFLAGREIGWFVVGCSLLASNIGSEHIVGLAGNGASSGMAMAHWELHAWVMLLLGWVFVPFYYRSNVFTMPEFLERRFDSRTRWALSLVSLVAYVFTKVSVTVYAGAIVFQALLPDTFGSPENAFWVGALTTVILTGIYTIFGGLRAVVYTEVAQTVLLLSGSLFISIFALGKLGGWSELKLTLAAEPERFALWRPLSDPNFPWLGVMIASPIIGIWYWCTDQYIVQRTLAARNLVEARRGSIFGGFRKVLPVFIFLVPGMIGYALHKKGIMPLPVNAEGAVQGDAVFPTMVTNLLPAGLRGIVVAGLISALMSSLASLFNSCATLFTVDIYSKLRPGRPDKELVRVGRIATGVVVVLGILWIPIMPLISKGGLYEYLQAVQGYLAPPITAVFLLGLFFKRINSRGAFTGLVVGFLLGILKLVAQAMVGAKGGEGLFVQLAQMNFLYYSGVLFLVSIVIVIVASLTAPPPDEKKIIGLTYGSVTPEQKAEVKAGIGMADYVGTAFVLALVFGIYLYFSFWLS